jgi:hypothetical protein
MSFGDWYIERMCCKSVSQKYLPQMLIARQRGERHTGGNGAVRAWLRRTFHPESTVDLRQHLRFARSIPITVFTHFIQAMVQRDLTLNEQATISSLLQKQVSYTSQANVTDPPSSQE